MRGCCARAMADIRSLRATLSIVTGSREGWNACSLKASPLIWQPASAKARAIARPRRDDLTHTAGIAASLICPQAPSDNAFTESRDPARYGINKFAADKFHPPHAL